MEEEENSERGYVTVWVDEKTGENGVDTNLDEASTAYFWLGVGQQLIVGNQFKLDD